jgi:hypothetical protein
MESENVPIKSRINEYVDSPINEEPTYVTNFGHEHRLSDDILMFLTIYEAGNEKFVEFGYTTDLEHVGNYKLPYGGEVLFFARNIPFWRIIGFEKRDPILKSNSKLSLLKYKPLRDFEEGVERFYSIDSIPIFRKFFKKLEGYEVTKEELIELKDNIPYQNDRPWEYHIDSPEEREEAKKYDNGYEDQSDWHEDYFDAITDGQFGSYSDWIENGNNLDELAEKLGL